MKAGTAAAVALAGLMASGSVMADGNQFLIQCQTLVRAMDSQGPADFDTGHCMGVVQAVTDMLALYQDQLPKKFCVPSTVTYGQGARIVAKYLQENPKFLNNQDTVLVLAAYANAYGCK